MNLGFWEIVAIAGIALLFFGPSRLPSLGKSAGEAIRGFKKGIEGLDEQVNNSQAPHASEPGRELNMDQKAKEPVGGGSDRT